jgi:hypothetical protein
VFRIPRYAIFVFVGLSILTAFAIHRSSLNRDVRTPASGAQSKNSIASASSVFSQLFGQSEDCNCRNKVTDSSDLIFESERDCSPQRNYLSGLINAIPAAYREERVRTAAEFPRECVLYVMNASGLGSDQKPSAAFAQCGSNGTLQSPQFKPCVTKNYVSVVYNYMSDFADCFNFSQRSLIPRFFRESGLHTNAQNAQGGIGLAQITETMVIAANHRFSEFQSFVQSSAKESCQRLSPLIQTLKPIKAPGKNSCANFTKLQDPLLNLFYFSMIESQNRDQLLSIINNPNQKYDVFKKLEKMGLANGSYDQERLLEMLQILSYNLGASSTLIHFMNYLEQFPLKTHALTKEDLSIRSKRDILSFPDYLRRFQLSGDSNYLNDIFEKAAELNIQFEEGTCAPEMFLSL